MYAKALNLLRLVGKQITRVYGYPSHHHDTLSPYVPLKDDSPKTLWWKHVWLQIHYRDFKDREKDPNPELHASSPLKCAHRRDVLKRAIESRLEMISLMKLHIVNLDPFTFSDQDSEGTLTKKLLGIDDTINLSLLRLSRTDIDSDPNRPLHPSQKPKE